MQLIFTNTAEKQFKKLSVDIQDYLKVKFKEYQSKEDLLKQNLKTLQNLEPATHRLKIGSYRFLLEINDKDQVFRVLKVGHRKNIYK